MIALFATINILVVLGLGIGVIYLIKHRMESKRIIGQLYIEAITDGLTKLANYRYFQLRLAEEVERAHRYKHSLSLLMIDIDHFKQFNDAHGHQKGDKMLARIAAVIKAQTRKVDIAARYGGEEFAVILPETNQEGARILAERLRSTLGETPLTPGSDLGVTVSIGVTTYDANDTDYTKEHVIGEADHALYRAKHEGRNRTCIYDPAYDILHEEKTKENL